MDTLTPNRERLTRIIAHFVALTLTNFKFQKFENMRSSNKSRSRNKSSNRRNNSSGNIVNRVFDSAGPDGRVRGTPQQIIEKYSALAHDALMADDRVAAESFRQHAEHYNRILAVAQLQQAEQQAQHAQRQAEQQAQHAQRQAEQNAKRQKQQSEKSEQISDQPDVGDGFEQIAKEQPSENLVPTPENKPKSRTRSKPAAEPVKMEKPAAE